MGNEDENQKAILARRARYIAMAVAGVSTATTATACVCLSPVGSDTSVERDSGVTAGDADDSDR